MAHGGRRPGAGRKKGSVPKKRKVRSARCLAAGDLPIDIMLMAARELAKEKLWVEAAAAAAKVAPYVHQKFTATAEPAARHPAQKVQGELPLTPPDALSDDLGADPWDHVLN